MCSCVFIGIIILFVYAIEHCEVGQADMDTRLRTQEQSETPEATQILRYCRMELLSVCA